VKIIAFANQKGGVGKTTSVINCSAALAAKEKKVLMVDMDPQAHLTAGSGISPYKLEVTIYDVMKGEAEPQDVVINLNEGPGQVDLLPASISLAAAEADFITEPGREYLLRESLLKIASLYDYIVIDCPPSLGILTVNAFTAADSIIIPLQTEYFALHGTRQLMQIINKVQSRLNPDLTMAGVLITMLDSRNNIHTEIVEAINDKFADQVFKTVIRRNVALVESPSFGQSIFDYKPSSTGAKDYKNFVEELLKVG
jgi:chromosome partitioning protein